MSYKDLSSEELLQFYLSLGDEDIFSELYTRHKKLVYNIALNIVRQYDIAEEVTQETFVKFHKRVAQYSEEKGSVRVYLCTIARGEALRVYERSKSRSILIELKEFFFVPKKESIDHVIFTKEVEQKIANALKKLSEKEQNIFYMKFYEELTVPEIAKELKLNENTVNSYIFRTRAFLVALLGNTYHEYIHKLDE